jgi:hypothetical protein
MADGSSASSFILMGNSLAQGYNDYSSLNAQGDFTRAAYETNARYAEMQADDVMKRGKVASNQQRKKTKQLIGAQRAALAAQGVEVNSGSGLMLQEEAMEMGAADARMIENNAFREAWGMRAQASEMRFQGRVQQMANKYAARNAVLVGGTKALGYGAELYDKNKINSDKKKGG